MLKNNRGFAPLILIIIIVAVVAVIGAGAYVVLNNNNKKNDSKSSTTNSTNTTPSTSNTTPSSTSSANTPACSSATLQSLAQTAYPGAYVNQPLCANGYAIGEMNVPQQQLNGWVVYYQAQNGQWVYLKAAQMGDPCSAALMPSGFPVSLCNQWQQQNNNNNNGNNENNNNNN